MEWSPTKQKVFAFESDIVVSAGAGSGKTAALIELYLRLMAGETRFPRRLTTEEVVAITFTDKAALEMKERIRKGMAERLAQGDSLLWKENLRALPAAPIATFHAFCARLLRENPAEAGIDPSFTLLDELAAWAELRGALDEVIEDELRNRTTRISLLLEQYPLSGAGRGRGLREHLLDLRRKRSASGGSDEDLSRVSKQWDDEAEALFREGYRELGELVPEVERVLGGKELGFHARLRNLPELYRQSGLDPDSDVSLQWLKAIGACIGGYWGKEGELKKRLEECIESLGLACRQRRVSPLAAALLALSGRLEQSYRLRKDRRGALDFDDLQVRTRDLLRNDETIRTDCRRRFPVIMVDEFQDTNPLQKELLELLCGDEQRLFIVGDPKQSIYLFRGADVSVFGSAQEETVARGGQNLFFQESFRSRAGIIEFINSLFSRVMGEGGREIPAFDVRYREGDHLQPQRPDWQGIPCVELLAAASGDSGGERRRSEARAIAQKILRTVSGEEGIQVYDREPGTGDRGPGNSEDKLKTVFTPRTPCFWDIAILFRRFTHLKLFEQELRRCAIPYYVVKGKGFYRCQEVLDLLNFLRYLEFRGERAALAGVLRSPLCGVSDETLYLLSRLDGGIDSWENCFSRAPAAGQHSPVIERIDAADREKLRSLALLFERLRPLRDRLTLPELMEEVLAGTDFVSSLYATFQGEQKAANLRKLIEFSRSFSGEGEAGLRGFVAFLAEMVEIEPTEAEAVISAEGENVVRLMTVHQSKGLEFPVVFVPEIGAGAHTDHSPVQYDDALGIGMKLAASGGKWEPSLASRAITELRNRKEHAELKRLFYVATTRARDYLVLSGERGRNRSGAWREWIDAFIEDDGARLLKVTHVDSGLDPEHGGREAAHRASSSSGLPLRGEKVEESGCQPAAVLDGIRRSLHFTAPLPSSMVFSPTALEDYDNCPRKYFYKAIMGLDEGLFAELLGEPRGPRRGAGKGMTPLEKGDLAHLMLERLDFAADPVTMRAAALRIAAAHAPDPGVPAVQEVIDTVMAFARSPRGRALANRQLMREIPFTLRMTGEAVYFIRGAMDLVIAEADRVTVCDYKYVNKGDADLEGYRFQLRVYMLALARAWPGKRIEGRLLFLKGCDEEPVESDLRALEMHLLRLMDAIRSTSREDQFVLRNGCDGRHCPFRQRCMKNGSTSDVQTSMSKPEP